MSRTVRDTALLLQVLAGPDSRDPNTTTDAPPDYAASLEGRRQRMAHRLER